MGSSEGLMDRLSRFHSVYEPGAVIIREGDPSTDVFVLLKGSARVSADGVFLRELTPGAGDVFFGETATILGRPRTATVTAGTQCVTVRIRGDALVEFLASCPRLLGSLLHQLAARAAGSQDPHR